MQSRSPNVNYHRNHPCFPPAPLFIPFRSNHHPDPSFHSRFPHNDSHPPQFYRGREGGPSYLQQSPSLCRPHPHSYRLFERQGHFRGSSPSYNNGRHNGGHFHGVPRFETRAMVRHFQSSPSPPQQPPPAPPLEFVLRTSITTPPPDRFSNSNLIPPRVNFEKNFMGQYRPQYPVLLDHKDHLGNGHEDAVAVGPDSPEKVVQNCKNSDNFYTEDDDEEESENEERSTDSSNNCPQAEEEEYEPEHPEIGLKPSCHQSISPIPVETMTEESNNSIPETNGMTACDEDGFYEVSVGACVSHYPTGTGRMIEIAGYGVWSSNEHQILSGVLDETRPQTIKPIMIYGSAKAVEFMKNQGFSRIRLNLESDYLNKNVLGWISKYMENPDAQPANWDEFKYQIEINALCASATGMIIKWSHVSNTSNKRMGLLKANYLAKAATDTWVKDLKVREEAVGTGSYD